MTETLETISDIITRYRSGEWHTIDRLRKLLKELSICHYELTGINIEAYNDWTSIIYNRDKNDSVASAKVKADFEVPELRMTRKLLESVKNILMSMQQELSIIKND
jgi:hypothetical protein